MPYAPMLSTEFLGVGCEVQQWIVLASLGVVIWFVIHVLFDNLMIA